MGYGSNILGNPLNKVTANQFEARKNINAQTGDRVRQSTDSTAYSELAYAANSGCWIRLASLVDIVDTSKNSLLKKLGAGDGAAKNWMLFGGTPLPGLKQRFGLGAYSVGYNDPLAELGYRPMPGIVSANINTAGRNGSLKVAELKIKANTLEQLEVLDLLYFRLGFSCLIEWGHVVYLDSSTPAAPTVKTFDASRLIDPFASDLTKEEINRKIYKTRNDTHGNYDGLYGLITNYNWQALEDGTYDCTLKITGLGSVLDSLKINNIAGAPTPVGAKIQAEYDKKKKAVDDRTKQIENLNKLIDLYETVFQAKKKALEEEETQLEALGENRTDDQQLRLYKVKQNLLSFGGSSLKTDDFSGILEKATQDAEVKDRAGFYIPPIYKENYNAEDNIYFTYWNNKRYTQLKVVKLQQELDAANKELEPAQTELNTYQGIANSDKIVPGSAIEGFFTDLLYVLKKTTFTNNPVVGILPPAEYLRGQSETETKIIAENLGPDYFLNAGLRIMPTLSEITSGTYGDGEPVGSLRYNFARGFNSSVLLQSPGYENIPKVNWDDLLGLLRVRIQTATAAPNEKNNNKVALTGGGVETEKSVMYVKFGMLLALINATSAVYEYKESSEKKKPMVYIDFNPETNLCYQNEFQYSINPEICLISFNAGVNENVFIKAAEVNKIPEGVAKEILADVDASITALKPNSNPAVTSAAKLSDYSNGGDTTKPGKLMEVWISVDYLRTKLSEFSTGTVESNVYLSAFLERILQDIQTSLGNVNNFRVGYNDDSNCLTIYDDQITDYKADYDLPVLPVFGLTSIAKNFSISTETSTKLGSMLAITAMDPGSSKEASGNLNSDGSAFTRLNDALRDRVMSRRTTNPVPNQEDKSDSNPQPENRQSSVAQAFESFVNYSKAFYFSDFFFDADENDKNVTTTRPGPTFSLPTYQQAAVNFYIGSMNLIKGKPQKDQNGKYTSITANNIMPITTNITVGGIGSITMYEGFLLPADRLPKQYLDENGVQKVGFIVTGLSHTIQNNTWNTAIKGNMVNIPEGELTKRAVPKIEKPRRNTSSGGGRGSSGAGPTVKCGGPTSWQVNLPGKPTVPADATPPKIPDFNPGGDWGSTLNVKAVYQAGETVPSNKQGFQMSPNSAKRNAGDGTLRKPIRTVTLHYTVSNSSDPLYHYKNTWNSNGNEAHADFTIARNGAIAGFANYNKYKANHYGDVGDLNRSSIGIEIEAWGMCVWCEKKKTFITSTNQELPLDQVVINNAPYRGFNIWHRLSTAQVLSIAKLLVALSNEKTYDGKSSLLPSDFIYSTAYNILFPENAIPETAKTYKGLITHGTGRSDKYDIHPQPDLFQMIQVLPSLVAKYKGKYKLAWEYNY